VLRAVDRLPSAAATATAAARHHPGAENILTLLGSRILWRRMRWLLLTRFEPGVEKDLPADKIHMVVLCRNEKKAGATITENDLWVQR
jgi:hypothetical protein